MFAQFSVDFTDRSGLTLAVRGKRGITESDVSPIQIKMLNYNEIPGFLPVTAEERDFVYTFYYHFSGKRILAQRLKNERLTIRQYFCVLYAIVRAVAECGNYMLDEGNVCLRGDLIFTDRDYTDIRLVYLPMKSPVFRESLQERLSQLAAGLVASVDELHGDGVQEIMKALNGDSFQLAEFRALLRTMVDRASVMPIAERNLPRETERKQIEQGANIRRKWALAAIPLALAALSWIWALAEPSEAKVYIALGVSLLAGEAGYLALKHAPLFKRAQKSRRQADALDSQPLKSAPASPATVFLGSGQAVSAGRQGAKLELRLDGKSITYELFKQRILIGRGDSAGIVLDSVGISRAHCEIERVGQTYAVKDLGSVNGSFLNGEKLLPYKSYTLHAGDVIRIVKAELVFKA
ncbi:MAG TPA: DUF6382 domain-containing protein [Bacilli bacterium]